MFSASVEEQELYQPEDSIGEDESCGWDGTT